MKPSRIFETDTDGESIFSVINAVVFRNSSVKFCDKHDCAMDLWLDFMRDDEGNQRPNKQVNHSFIKKRVNDRIKNWLRKAYRRLEYADEITDTNYPLPVDEVPNFLWVHEQEEVHNLISRDIIDEYNELFCKTVKELAKEHNTTQSAIKKRRSRFLSRARLEVAELNPQLFRDIKRSQ